MEFFSYRTGFQVAKSLGRTRCKTHREWASEIIPLMEAGCWEKYGVGLRELDPFTPSMILSETFWAEGRMPYYNIWPQIIPSLTKLRMDIECGFFKLPLDYLLVRFPKTNNPLHWSCDGNEWTIQTMMLCEQTLLADPRADRRLGIPRGSEVPSITFWLDIGEVVDPDCEHLVRRLYKHLLRYPGWTIERSFAEIPAHESADHGVKYPQHIVENCARIACALCLMAADPTLVVPDVLAADKESYDASPDQRLVDKAHKRGKVGWNVGANVEVSPHIRSASPAALYWTGEGRKVPRIRFRKGCIVHRRRMAEVPTGYLLPHGEQRKGDT